MELGEGYRFKIIVIDEEDNMSISNYPYMKFETGYRKKILDIKTEVDRTIKFIKITWNYPVNGIEKHIIYRSKGIEPLKIVKTIGFPKNVYEDKELNMGNFYEYRIKAIFKDGAESIIR